MYYRDPARPLPGWPDSHERDYQELLRQALDGTLTSDEFKRIRGPDYDEPGFTFSDDSMDLMRGYHMRDKFIRDFGFCIVTIEYADSLTRLLRGLRVVEVCAGHGRLQGPMRERGIDWTSTDKDPWNESVEKLEALEAVQRYKPDVVYASWIDLGSDLDARLARMLPCVFLAESCTGTQDSGSWWDNDDRGFHELEIPDWFESTPSWRGIRDFTVITVPDGHRSPFHLDDLRVVEATGGTS